MCGNKMIHKFWEDLICNFIIQSHQENVTASGNSRDGTNSFTSQLSQLQMKHSQHWLSKGKQILCSACSLRKKKTQHPVLL
jgi:hypothetical protein